MPELEDESSLNLNESAARLTGFLTRRRWWILIPFSLVTLFTIVFLFSLTGFQITSQTAATRLLGRIGASLIEVDRWLPMHQEELQLRADDRPTGAVPLSNVPIDAEIPSS